MTPSNEQALRQCTHEIKALLHRWSQESDLEDSEILDACTDAIEEYFDEDVVDFESDMDEELDG